MIAMAQKPILNPLTGKFDFIQNLSGYVPYSGATSNVDIGAYSLTANTITDGTFSVTGGAITGATNTNWDAAYTHVSNNGTDHSYIDQDVTITATPTFDDLTITTPVNIYALSHNSFADSHNLTTDIDHDSITNTHNLTTDIDHDSITNTHNLTTDIDHDQLTNFSADEHFTEASIDHTNIQSIGSNTHAQIDTHIADVSNPHSVALEQTISIPDRVVFYDDFIGAISSRWGAVVSGTGATTKIAGANGIVQVASGTGYALFVDGWVIYEWDAGSNWTLEAYAKADAISAGTGEIAIGGRNVGTNHDIWFYADASDVWVVQNRAGGAWTSYTTAYSTTVYRHLKFVATSSSIAYYIDGDLVATHTTNIPTNGMDIVLYSSKGTSAAHNLYVDAVLSYQDR